MRADAARADRAHAVRAAADGWRRAGVIDEATLAKIVSAYPDDRARLRLGFRILVGIAAFVGGQALASLIGMSTLAFDSARTLLMIVLAVLFTAVTEVQLGRLRRAQAGAEYATAILASASASLALMSLFDRPSLVQTSVAFVVVFAPAAWRWGYALLAAWAALSVLLAFSQGELSRGVWLTLGCVALPLILLSRRSPRWPPAQRRCLAAAGLVFLAGAYLATNLYSLDSRWVEAFWQGGGAAAGAWARRAAAVGTILMPPIVLGLGVRFRDRSLLTAGALFTAATLATLRHYHPLGPFWLFLALGGAACLALAVTLRRWLDAGPGRERWGLTAEPLFEHRRMLETAQAAATLVALSPGPQVAPQAPFEGGGGRSGGGGATGKA